MHTWISNSEEVKNYLSRFQTTELKSSISLAELIRRPELDYYTLSGIDKERPSLPQDVCDQVNISVKYEGYLQRQIKQVEQFKKLEGRRIPDDLNYDDVPSLRLEARQKLKKYRPESIGQASRIAGVSPADVSVLVVFLKNR